LRRQLYVLPRQWSWFDQLSLAFLALLLLLLQCLR